MESDQARGMHGIQHKIYETISADKRSIWLEKFLAQELTQQEIEHWLETKLLCGDNDEDETKL